MKKNKKSDYVRVRLTGEEKERLRYISGGFMSIYIRGVIRREYQKRNSEPAHC